MSAPSDFRFFSSGPLSPLGTARQRLGAATSAASAGTAAAGDAVAESYLAELGDADLGPESLFLCWQIAALAGALRPDERRALMAIFVRALIGVAGGSTRTEVSATETALLARATDVVGRPGDRRPFILDGRFLYQQRLLACEERLAVALRGRRDGAPLASDAELEPALQAIASGGPAAPTAEQLDAVRAALRGRLTVVSGGPGTGKTTIVLAILRALLRLGVAPEAVALAAPTGKAANRLEEAIQLGLRRLAPLAAPDTELERACPPAQTLHRLLGWSPRRGAFVHHQNNRLAQKVIIVDESSMIDLSLMERLVRAVADDARLVLLGDADQLPSIEAGAVFRDLSPLAHRLTRSHRVDTAARGGQQLGALARALRDGGELAIEPAPVGELTFEGTALVSPVEREALLERWCARQLAFDERTTAAVRRVYRTGEDGHFAAGDREQLERLHAHLHRTRVLCVTHGRPTGTLAVNEWLHRRRSENDGQGRAGGPFAAGEPVMVLRNDYQRGLYNGDQGVVISYAEDDDRAPRLAAAFPTRAGWQAWALDGIGDALELSYAMTVHKSQGSELDAAILLLPDAPIPILTRELLYTAVTRARHGVAICGRADVLAAGASAPLIRSSGLAERLG
jgi:exodeoxyribonuclease V alpha subunit